MLESQKEIFLEKFTMGEEAIRNNECVLNQLVVDEIKIIEAFEDFSPIGHEL